MKLDTQPKIRRKRGERERAVLAGVTLPDEPPSYREPLDELSQLADTAGADSVAKLVQRREKPDGRTFFGKGNSASSCASTTLIS